MSGGQTDARGRAALNVWAPESIKHTNIHRACALGGLMLEECLVKVVPCQLLFKCCSHRQGASELCTWTNLCFTHKPGMLQQTPGTIPCTEKINGKSGLAVCAGQAWTYLMKEGTQDPKWPCVCKSQSTEGCMWEVLVALYSSPCQKAAVLLLSQKTAEFLCVGKISCEMTEKNFVVFPKEKREVCLYSINELTDWLNPALGRTCSWSRVAFWQGILLLRGTFNFFEEIFPYD